MAMPDATRDPFELSQLPQPVPPGDPWPAIASALQRRRRGHFAAFATAAAVMLALGLGWQLRPPGSDAALSTPDAEVASSTPGRTEPAPAGAAPGQSFAANPLASLEALSQQLEVRVRRLRTEAGPLPAEALVYQVELEDLVAQVDEAINRRPESAELWSQRVNLLLDLDQLYRQALRREPGQVASL